MPQILDVSPTADNTSLKNSAQEQSVTGRMLTLACSSDGQTVYTGSYANIWKSQDAGQTFSQLTWPQPPANQFGVPGAMGGWCVMDLAVSPVNANVVLALVQNDRKTGDSGIWRTEDGGSNWARVHKTSGFQAFGQLAWGQGREFSRLVCAANGGSLSISHDGGHTFQDVLVRQGIHHVLIGRLNVFGRPTLFALGDSRMFLSFDLGFTWKNDPGPLPLHVGGAVGFDNSQAPATLVVVPHKLTQAFVVANANGGKTVGPASVIGPFVSDYHDQQHFAYFDNLGILWDAFWDGDSSQWNLQSLNLGGKTDGPAAAANGGLGVSVYHDQQHFAYQDSAGTIWDAFWDSNNWNLQQLNLGGKTNGPAAAPGGGPNISVYHGQQHFAYQDSAGTIWDAFWNGSSWHVQQLNLGGKTNGPAAAPGGAPFGSVYHDQQHFAYQDSAGTVWDAFWDTSHWNLQQLNLGGKTNGPAAAPGGGPYVSVYHDQQHFAYQDSAGTIWDAFWDGSHWKLQQLNLGGKTNGPAAAAGGGPFVSVYNDQQHFAYQEDGGAIGDAFWNGSHWAFQQINLQRSNPDAKTDGNAAAARGGPFICPYHNQQHFAYLDQNGSGAIWDAFWDGDNSQWDLQRLNLGPMLWQADYDDFLNTGTSVWRPLVTPNFSDQDSGNVFLAVTPSLAGGPLFYGAQRSKVYVATSDGPLSPDNWQTLDDSNKVHVDLHGIFVSPDFIAEIDYFNYHYEQGMMWLLSDGGVHWSKDGGKHFQPSKYVTSLACVNIAGTAVEGKGPILSLNTGDNDGFFSADGGDKWISQDYGGGDNDCSFADPLRPNSLLIFTPRWDRHGHLVAGSHGQTVTVYETHPGQLPNAGYGTNQAHTVPGPPPSADGGHRWTAVSPFVLAGYRPLILNLADDDPSSAGDYVFVRFKSKTEAVLLRTQNIRGIHHASDWDGTITGPPLPAGAQIVQASGGHVNTVYYVSSASTPDVQPSSPVNLWKWSDGMADWQQLVPNGGAQSAFRFFVDPYRPNLIYVLDNSQPHMMRSDDGGATWLEDDALETQLTCGHTIPMDRDETVDGQSSSDAVLTDMQFHPSDPLTRIAAGFAGVFQTPDGGKTWTRLLDTAAMPGRVVNCYWDWISAPAEPTLYVGLAGRSVVKILLA